MVTKRTRVSAPTTGERQSGPAANSNAVPGPVSVQGDDDEARRAATYHERAMAALDLVAKRHYKALRMLAK